MNLIDLQISNIKENQTITIRTLLMQAENLKDNTCTEWVEVK